MASATPKTTVKPQTQPRAPKPSPRPHLTPAAQPAAVHSQSLLQRAEVNPLSLTRGDLQRLSMAAGQQAVQRVVNRPEVRQARSIPVATPIFRPMAQLQAKLAVGPVGDKYEQEADQVARQVMMMPAPVQRQHEVGDEELMRKPLGPQTSDAAAQPPLAVAITPVAQRLFEEEEEIQTKRDAMHGGFAPGKSFESQLRRTHGTGRAIPDSTRAFMESRIGADFSGVRLHTNHQAVQLSRQINAQAFTLGRDIYFGEGKANLASGAGKRLLAHELTHTIQQGAAPVQRKPQTHNADGKIQLSATKPTKPVVQRLLNVSQMTQKLMLGKKLAPGQEKSKSAEVSWWRRKLQSEQKQKNHLISRFKTAMDEISSNKSAQAAKIGSFYGELTALHNDDEELRAKSVSDLMLLVGQAETIQKGLGIYKRMMGDKLKAQTVEFQKSVDNYHNILKESTAGGLLSAPEFVLDQVFARKGVKGLGASAGNLDVGVGDALAAHYELLMTTKAYVATLKQQKEDELAKTIEDYLPEIEQEKEYMYQGLKANREQGSMNLADAINKGRELLGKGDVGQIKGLEAKGDALPKDTPLGFLELRNVPGVKTLDPEGEHLKWLQDDGAREVRQPEEKKEAKEEKKESSPDISKLTSLKTLGAGAEGEVTLYESYKLAKLTEEGGEEAIPDKQYAVKTTRSAGRENLIKEYAAYKHLGAHTNLPKVHGMGAVQFGQDKRAGMVMDFVKGPNGERAMRLLREKGKKGELTPKQYWGAIQFITQRLMNVIKHLSSKGIAHNDIKPENFVIGENGEPMLIDLGLHSLKGEAPSGTTKSFAPAQLTKQVTSGEETDMFMVASTMLAGVEGWRQSKNWKELDWSPSKGLESMPDQGEESRRVAGDTDSRDMEDEYSKFMAKILGTKGQATVPIAEAERDPFVARPLLSDEEAKQVLMNLTKEEAKEQKNWWEDIKPRWAPREAGQGAKKRRAAKPKAEVKEVA